MKPRNPGSQETSARLRGAPDLDPEAEQEPERGLTGHPLLERTARARKTASAGAPKGDLQEIVDDLKAVVWEADPVTCAFTFVSAQAEALPGYPLGEWLSDPQFWPKHIHPEDREWAVSHCRRESAAGRDHDVEYRMIAADGRVVWIRDVVHVARDETGRLCTLRGLMIDVTAQRETAQALRDSRARLQLINAVSRGITAGLTVGEIVDRTVQTVSEHVVGARVAYCTIDGSGSLHVVRSIEPEGMPALTGLEADLQVAPLYLAELREGRPVIVADIANDARLKPLAPAMIEGGTRAVLDIPLRPSDELVGLICLDSPAPRQWSENEVGMLGEVADVLSVALRHALVEEHDRQAQQASRASQERFRTLFEHAPIGVGLGCGGVWFQVNPAFARLYGFQDPSEVRGMQGLDLVAPQDRKMVAEIIRRREAGEPAPESYRLMAQRQDGSPFPVHARVARIQLADGPATVAFVTDLTEHERAEQALRAQEDRLRDAQKMEAIGRLAGGVAHDFNNLLMVILGYSDRMLAGLAPNDPRGQAALEIKRTGEQAARLTRQLLAFGRMQPLELEDLELNQVLEGQREMLAGITGEHIELEIHPGENLWTVRADPGQLRQVVLNLVMNARDAMPRGGRLTLATANVEVGGRHPAQAWDVAAGQYVELTVTDTGVGMNAETQARAFEPFFTTKEPGAGTGLGLSTVHGIVRQSGGSVGIVTTLGQRTAFHVFLPRARGIEAGGAQAAARPEFAARAKGGAETVLLVEDHATVRLLVRDMLIQGGHRVLEARDGEEALELLRTHPGPVQLILTDVVMPRMNGRELVERILQDRPGTRVLFMSAHSEDVLALRGIGSLQGPLLMKPFTADVLARWIREVLEASAPA